MWFYKSIEECIKYMVQSFEFESWYAVVISFNIWGLLYFTIRGIISKQSPEYCNRVLTMIHGIITATQGLNQCFGDKSPFDNPQAPTTELQAFILATSLGYFLFDLAWCLYYQTETSLMIAHHIYSCYALARMLFKGIAGRQTVCGLGALEITNPLLQTRWLIRSHGHQDSALYTAVEITFMIVFVIVRVLLGTAYLIIVSMQGSDLWEFKILTAFIYIMSWMFMINIVRYFAQKYLKNNVRVESEMNRIHTS